MTVTIGSAVFDGGTGFPQAALSKAQRKSWADAARALKLDGEASTAQGTISLWKKCNKTEAQALIQMVGGYVTAVVSVVYSFATVSGVTLAAVDGAWRPMAGVAEGGVCVVNLTFDNADDEETGDTERSTVQVETATALAGPWTVRPWVCFGASGGAGTYIGEAEAFIDKAAPDPAMVGLWVRLRDQAAPNKVRFHGKITGVRATGQANTRSGVKRGCRSAYRFSGLGHVLSKMRHTRWLESLEVSVATYPCAGATQPTRAGEYGDAGTLLTFNEGGAGDMSVSDFTIDTGIACRLHTRSAPTEGSNWNAWHVVRTLIAQYRADHPGCVAMALDPDCDPDNVSAPKKTLLTYSTEWKLAGKHLLAQIAEVLSPEHGVTFSLEEDGSGGILVRVEDLTAVGATIDLTEPGTPTLDHTPTNVDDWTADIDGSNVADALYLDAGPREFISTVKFHPDTVTSTMAGWWSDANATAWDAADDAGKVQPEVAHVHHRFRLQANWLGFAYDNTNAIPCKRTVNGTGEESGELEFDGVPVAEETPPNGFMWKLSRTIPAGLATDPTDAYAKNKPKDLREGPMVFLYKSGEALVPLHYDYQIRVGDKVASLFIGRTAADAKAIKAKTEDDGFDILATLSFIHPYSWRASRRQTALCADSIRVAYVDAPASLKRRIDVVEGAVLKLDAAGAIVPAEAGRRDNGPSLAAMLDKLEPWFFNPSRSAAFSVNAIVDDLPKPAAMVASLKVVISEGNPRTTGTILVGAPVARYTLSFDKYAPKTTIFMSQTAPALGDGDPVVAQNGDPVVMRNKYVAGGLTRG